MRNVPKHPAELELTRVRQVYAQRHLVQLAGLLDALADVIQLAQEGSPDARAVLSRLQAMLPQAQAAAAGLKLAQRPPES